MNPTKSPNVMTRLQYNLFSHCIIFRFQSDLKSLKFFKKLVAYVDYFYLQYLIKVDN